MYSWLIKDRTCILVTQGNPCNLPLLVSLLPNTHMCNRVKQCLCVCVCVSTKNNIEKCFKEVFTDDSKQKTISINQIRTFLYLVQVQAVNYAIISATSYISFMASPLSKSYVVLAHDLVGFMMDNPATGATNIVFSSR